MTKFEKQKGFTLIELMIVIAIIGILAAIAIPSFSSIRIKAFNSTAQADAKNGVTAAESFYIDALVYPNSATIVTGPNSISLTGTNLSTATWNLSDKVSAVFTKGATVGFCLRAKHISGDRLYMASDTTKLPIQLTALATAGAVLDAAGATSATTDCSGVIATTIAGYAIN